ncbi:MAG: biotin--[acetyl-CoA-carboxylase] ligase [Phycisphaerae bacterium]|nr:biotin--[acetyl-CoA-carboxylase] ligase [Phycisphaerae bacterium]
MTLPTDPCRIRVEWSDELDSTMLEARRRVDAHPDRTAPLALAARRQYGGIGRLGRRWFSPPGGLWMTVVAPLRRKPEARSVLGLEAGLAVLAALDAALERTQRAAGLAPRDRINLKWPNDCLLNDRKVAGILTEVWRDAGGAERLSVGVGVNANLDPDALPEDLRARSTTLRHALGAETDLEALAFDLARRLPPLAEDRPVDPAVVARAAAERLAGLGAAMRVLRPDGSSLRGTFRGLRSDGVPLLDVPGLGLVPVGAGEWTSHAPTHAPPHA